MEKIDKLEERVEQTKRSIAKNATVDNFLKQKDKLTSSFSPVVDKLAPMKKFVDNLDSTYSLSRDAKQLQVEWEKIKKASVPKSSHEIFRKRRISRGQRRKLVTLVWQWRRS